MTTEIHAMFCFHNNSTEYELPHDFVSVSPECIPTPHPHGATVRP